LFNCGNLGFHGYITYHGYSGKTLGPNMELSMPSTFTQKWPGYHGYAILKLDSSKLTGASFASTSEDSTLPFKNG
jgi:hypothetical protein